MKPQTPSLADRHSFSKETSRIALSIKPCRGSFEIRGGSRANLKEGQLIVGLQKNFQKLVTIVRCIQQFQP